jgi:hypothetical protein
MDKRIALNRFLLGWSITFCLSSQLLAQTDAAKVVTFPLRRWEPIHIPVTVLDKSCTMILDSAADAHAFDLEFRDLLAKPTKRVRVRTAGRDIFLDHYDCPEILVDSLPVRKSSGVVVIDLTPLMQVEGCRLDGIIGAPGFLDCLIQLDFDQGVFRMQPNSTENERKNAAGWGTSFRTLFDGNTPCISNVSIGDHKELSFKIDTGATTILSLEESLFDRLVEEKLISRNRDVSTANLAGHRKNRSGFLKQLTVGPFEMTNVEVISSRSNLLGMGFLSQFLCTFDLGRGRLHLKQGKSFGVPVPSDSSGLHLLWKNEKVVVEIVDNGSPAEVAGIRPGDVIVRVNELAGTGKNLGRLRLALTQAGKTVECALQRKGEEIVVSLPLLDFLDWSSRLAE